MRAGTVATVDTEAPRLRSVDDRQEVERHRAGGARDILLGVVVFALGAVTSTVAHRVFPDPDGGWSPWTTLVLTAVAAVVAVSVHLVRRRRSR